MGKAIDPHSCGENYIFRGPQVRSAYVRAGLCCTHWITSSSAVPLAVA
jgi:hypothetical protein